MTEWQVFAVISALAGLGGIIIPPIVRLNSSVTKLMTVLQHLQTDIDKLSQTNKHGHERIWHTVTEQGELLNHHETRLRLIECSRKMETEEG